MEINYDSYLKDNLFFAEEILFDASGKKISQNEIDEMDDFPFFDYRELQFRNNEV